MILIIVILAISFYLIACQNTKSEDRNITESQDSSITEIVNNEYDDNENTVTSDDSNDDMESDKVSSEIEKVVSNDENSSTGSTYSDSSASFISSVSSHIHVWKEHTAKKWVPNIVTVTDKPESTVKYDIYRMYWYTTGEWEETRDPERFQEWYRSKEGGLYPLYHPYRNPEDNPLFIEYDENGNPSFTNDHVIMGPYYETISAVTHEEDHGKYENYIDYYYCDCGAVKK